MILSGNAQGRREEEEEEEGEGEEEGEKDEEDGRSVPYYVNLVPIVALRI